MILFEPETDYESKDRIPNIESTLYEKLNKIYKKKLTPEELLYYIYAVLYSNYYRKKYSEFLKNDFPRIPFTTNYSLFSKIAEFGNQLVDLHLMKGKQFNKTVSKFHGVSDNDRIEKVFFSEKEQRVYINRDKYFDNVKTDVWNYQIGGYQVLQKFLKDRKNRVLEDPRYYCRIITAVTNTIDIQKQIDKIYQEVEKDLMEF
jgi:predicted helicase